MKTNASILLPADSPETAKFLSDARVATPKTKLSLGNYVFMTMLLTDVEEKKMYDEVMFYFPASRYTCTCHAIINPNPREPASNKLIAIVSEELRENVAQLSLRINRADLETGHQFLIRVKPK